MNRVVHFEIQAADPERAARFYRQVFGWEVREWVVPGVEMPKESRWWLPRTGLPAEPGIDGGLLFRRGPAPSDVQQVNACVCTIAVASIDAVTSYLILAVASLAWMELSLGRLRRLQRPARKVKLMTGSDSPIVHVPYQTAYAEGFEDIERRVPDISKIRNLIGCSHPHTLDDSLDRIIAHERAR